MLNQIRNSAGTLGFVATTGGFIADVLTPLGPFTKWLFIFFSLLTILLYIIKKKEIAKKYLPLSLIFALIFGLLFLINGDSKNGVFGDNIDAISSLQTSLFDLQESINRVEEKVDNIDEKIELGFEKIEGLLKSNNPIENPSSAKDHIVNAYLYKSSGMLKKSQFSFDEYFRLTNDFKVDVLLDYCEVYESNNGFVSLKNQLSLLPSTNATRIVKLIKTSIDKKNLVKTLFNDSLNDPDLIKWAILVHWELESKSWLTHSNYFDYGNYLFTSHVDLGYYCEKVHHFFFNNSKAHVLILSNSYAKQPMYFVSIDWKKYYPDFASNPDNYLDDLPYKYSNPFFPQDQYDWTTLEYQNKADDLEKIYLQKREEGWFR